MEEILGTEINIKYCIRP